MKIAVLGDTALIGKYYPDKNNIERIKKRLEKVKIAVSDCDYIIANIETAITNKTWTREAKTLALRTSPKCVEILKYLGVNVACLANNHIYDYGSTAINNALEVLKHEGIQCVGLDNEPVLLEKECDKVLLGAWCCYSTNAWHYADDSRTGRLNTLTYAHMYDHIRKAKEMGAYPVLLAHWGEENTHYPKYEHLCLAEKLLDSERAIIIGHHPHVLQGEKQFKHGKAYFSIGNFCFDDCESRRHGIVLKQTADNKIGAICSIEYKNETISSKLVTIRDTDNEIILDETINQQLKKYSDVILHINDLEQYEKVRKQEQKIANITRLGKRDFGWLVHHLNIESAMAVYQRRSNLKAFSKNKEEWYDVKHKTARKRVVLYIGNFEKPSSSAAGKRVWGNRILLEKCGYEVRMIGKHISADDGLKINEEFSYFPEYGMIKASKYIQWLNDYQRFYNVEAICIIRYGSPCIAWFDKLLNDYGKRNGIPVIADVVDWLSVDGGTAIFKFVKILDTWIEKGILNKKSDGIIAISSYLEDYYNKKGKDVVVIPPLVESYLKPNNLANDRVKIVYAGSPFRKGVRIKNPKKVKDRLDVSIKTFAAIQNSVKADFFIYGLTKEEYLIAFPSQRCILENNMCVHFMGRQSMCTVQKEIQNSDFTLLLRDKNRATMAGFPTKIVESLSVGTPVITTKTSDLELYIEEGKQGFFVEIDDENILQNKLIQILQLSKEARMKLKAECSVQKDFLPDGYVVNMEKFMKKIINK